tara:strand:- start:943 stop:1587 length:645 start_codon:yes stop_codon:yes gene_type:complete
MDEDISAINTSTRNEKIKNFFIKNKKNIIIFLSIIVFMFFGYFAYDEIKEKNKIKIADQYYNSKLNFISGNKDSVKMEMIKVIEAKDKTYSPLALYFLLDNNLISSKDQINNFFDILINDLKLEKEIKNLIIYKKAIYNSSFETENNLLKMLNPIINSDSIWKSHSLYLLAEYFFSKEEKQKSKEFYEKILILENSHPKIRLEAQKRIKRDFSE